MPPETIQGVMAAAAAAAADDDVKVLNDDVNVTIFTCKSYRGNGTQKNACDESHFASSEVDRLAFGIGLNAVDHNFIEGRVNTFISICTE